MNGWIIYLICHVIMMIASIVMCAFVSKVKSENVDEYNLILFLLLSIANLLGCLY